MGWGYPVIVLAVGDRAGGTLSWSWLGDGEGGYSVRVLARVPSPTVDSQTPVKTLSPPPPHQILLMREVTTHYHITEVIRLIGICCQAKEPED